VSDFEQLLGKPSREKTRDERYDELLQLLVAGTKPEAVLQEWVRLMNELEDQEQ
jgi:hypothetical protein